ncbi:HlyD family type I secretion periplasmic adaptor subunit [Sphingomonas sp. NIBR02145]|uniref:HlyD family type I secretion periplasmic adaptor subunit n=1 Tax=Sphingomonas sp. NIBR02145 TaxID=3014784 RepID=UPI0022B5733F|nr:HlyD family type I secretion periplasmic adaptor subunit [Sphingomonas sp. NIBR02145]WHU01959.1 HlyD family type I secretion periplasmic adaptor subunit [Sphingomonas sp. NIBR02145]
MTLAARFPNLAHHWQVLRTAWRMESEAKARRRPKLDHEFLPAALEMIEKPPSPGLRWLMLLLCSLFGVALLWSWIGKVDTVAVATGKVVPSAKIKIIQPIEIGAVRAIHVRNGQRVKRGQLLIELDPTLAGADDAQASQGLLSARLTQARSDALVRYLATGHLAYVPPEGTPAAVAATQAGLARAAVAEYQAERASLQEARAQSSADLAAANAELAKLLQTLPLVDQQLEGRRTLTDKGYYSRLKLLEYEQLRVEHVQNIAVQRSTAAKARAAIANTDAQIARLRETFGKAAFSDLSEAEDKGAVASEEIRKTLRRRQYQELRSPVDGVVQQLAIHTVGGVVQPAQPLLVIVPSADEVEVEAQILNRDIGFIREGQPVRVKLEAFPFTDYGLIDGEVASISRDAIEDEKRGLIYAVRVRLKRRTIAIGGREMPIGPGLAVQAEIRTGERRIIQYLLSPIAETIDEAGRER